MTRRSITEGGFLMREKEAKRIIANIESGQYHLGQADGYLLAIEKAKGLEEVLRSLVNENCDIETVKIVLAKWEKEK